MIHGALTEPGYAYNALSFTINYYGEEVYADSRVLANLNNVWPVFVLTMVGHLNLPTSNINIKWHIQTKNFFVTQITLGQKA